MRIFILDTLYENFVRHLYANSAGLAQRALAAQQEVIDRAFFPSANYWTKPLRKLGHEVFNASVNNPYTQVRWCAENGFDGLLRTCADEYSLLARFVGTRPRVYQRSAENVRR